MDNSKQIKNTVKFRNLSTGNSTPFSTQQEGGNESFGKDRKERQQLFQFSKIKTKR